ARLKRNGRQGPSAAGSTEAVAKIRYSWVDAAGRRRRSTSRRGPSEGVHHPFGSGAVARGAAATAQPRATKGHRRGFRCRRPGGSLRKRGVHLRKEAAPRDRSADPFFPAPTGHRHGRGPFRADGSRTSVLRGDGEAAKRRRRRADLSGGRGG